MTTEFPDAPALRAAVALAARAPSANNRQPWSWLTDGHCIDLISNLDNPGDTSDRRRRDDLISCGVALHHLRIALAVTGWQAHVTLLPTPASPTIWRVST